MSVSRHSGMTVPLVLESIGDYVAPDMLGAYASLIDPQWMVLDILLHCEAIVEKGASKLGTKLARVPVSARVGSNGEILLAYQSQWRICQFIKGLVRGLGAHMDQPVLIDELRCMSASSPICEFAVKAERMRPARSRMASVSSEFAINTKSSSLGRLDRNSSLPPSPRGEPRSTPGLSAPMPPRFDPSHQFDPAPSTKRPTYLPPPAESDSGSYSLESLKNKRR
jgi:predicted hydrocarbon binding protein